MNGVCLLLCGMRFAERITVAVHSLRKHWQGPVTLFVTDDECEQTGRLLARGGWITQASRQPLTAVRNSAYATKTHIPAWTPYDATVFLDGDTVTTGPIDELFDAPLVLTQFADWVSTGSRMSKRIGGWRGVSPMCDSLIDMQLRNPWPAINTGVFAWHGKGTEWASQWREVTLAGNAAGHSFMADELAAQILFPYWSFCRVADQRFNWSPKFGTTKEDVRVIHYHGDGHLRPQKSEGYQTWLPAFWAAYNDNAGCLRDWAGTWDPWVRTELQKERAT